MTAYLNKWCASPELAELPVFFISGDGCDETIARALQVGAAGYVVKPSSPTKPTGRIREQKISPGPCPTRKKRLRGNARRGWPSLQLAVDVGSFPDGPAREARDPAAVLLAVHVGPFQDTPVR